MKLIRKKLSNGITLLYEPRELPLVSLSISNKFGAFCETEEIKGIAHFIEHLLFTGTKTRSHEDISREIEKRGGILNAFTDNNVTSFWFKLPSEHLMTGLDILADMLVNPIFKEEKFEKEKKVILEEIKMYHDDPRSHIYEKITENLYEKPFGTGIIGTKGSVSSLKRNFVMDCFKNNYSPENYIVTVIGKADIQKVADYLEKAFKKENKIPIPLKIKEKNAHSLEERPGLDQAHFLFAMHAPKADDKKLRVLEVLDAYLASGMSSKLFLTIREEKGLAYTVRSTIDAKKEYSYYSIYVGTTKEAIPEVKKLILEGFNKISQMTEKDLQEAKQRLIGLQKVSSEESISVMNELLYSEIATKAEDYYTYEKDISQVTLDDVKALANIRDYSTAAIVPK